MGSYAGAFQSTGDRHRRTGAERRAPGVAARRRARDHAVARSSAAKGGRTQLLAAGLALLVSLAIAIAPAARTEGPNRAPDFTTVSVAEGDTLWEIAASHPVPGYSTLQVVDLIRSANALEENVIYPGQLLSVPQAHDRPAAVASR